MTYRVFCAVGPGDIVKAWSEDHNNPRAITYLLEIRHFCRDVGAEAYIVSYNRKQVVYHDGPFTLEHRPKPMPGAAGLRYHIAQALYALSLLLTAIRFRADAAVIDSGTSHYFMFSLFKLAGIRTIIVLHNTLWPAGFPPTRLAHRIIAKLDSLYFRWLPVGTIGVSPECVRQVEQLTNGKHGLLLPIKCQFHREYFEAISAPSPPDQLPFRILFMGRITRYKGVFDVLEMARTIEAQMSGRVHWEIHGDGPDLEELRRVHEELGLKGTVLICGWTSPQEAQEAYQRSHVSIVPTRSSFNEGMAMSAVESILAGRPVITNSVVPAFEVLGAACVEAKTDDVDSYVQTILRLVDDPDRYMKHCKACLQTQEQFYNPDEGLGAALKKVLFPE